MLISRSSTHPDGCILWLLDVNEKGWGEGAPEIIHASYAEHRCSVLVIREGEHGVKDDVFPFPNFTCFKSAGDYLST